MMSTKTGLLRRLPIRFHELALVIAIIAVVALTTLLDTQHSYLKHPDTNFTNIARLTSMLGIFSLGAAVVILSGGIDLSAGSMIAFSGTMCATFMVLLNPQAIEKAEPLGTGVIVLSILGTLLIGLLVGTLHAWLIAIVRLPPFIATLGTLVGLRSLARVICFQVTESMLHAKNTSIPVFDSHFRDLATVVKIPMLIFLALALAVWLLLSRTVIGRHLYALGGNEEAARLSGIRTERVKWLAYCIGAVTAAIAGILYIADNSSAEPNNMAVGYELNAIAAAVVGGCSLLGGIGTIPGVVLGVLFLQVVIYGVGIVIKTDSETYQGLVVGLVLIFASVLSRFRDTARPNKQLFAGALGVCSIFTLSLLSGTLIWLMVNRGAGITGGIVTLAVLLALKVQESRALRVHVTVPAAPSASAEPNSNDLPRNAP